MTVAIVVYKGLIPVVGRILTNATHSSEILSLFTDDLRVYAEKNLGRSHYEYIARVLRGMRKLNGGKEAVKQLVDEFRVLYKRRPAMMEELGEFI
ncbi:hypothetical protein BACINT_04006 [Bacteroides intestinalis DSM 17393]|uniref:Uncharacterized protein n=1 Tax=Bacteroides intestinalis DSM 17393 TaxID=471870 RepID=B3CDL9_9BACE|nr:hypothetical protein [Bacteroides intestinalis]EDV04865.1 hypothetical protein BACINT_04006 [Bacteroides intestinalis DSM 17393]